MHDRERQARDTPGREEHTMTIHEPTVALAHPDSEGVLLKAIAKVLNGKLPEVSK